ncbi:EF-P 5-aminopentanol modification-associated protein YfmF [Pediococcus claussenii]|uniref:Zn-dependent peptidase n=1 Tax=Pediococcus claussenii (strain ATCC BAA-344 / DSM 14800 / JCM 18046 / KCTC 3811 / LMG 21948 / P06) TaxID=701521 RepID=G8PCL0_PEDCP|nr:pitrilysin family protein [Pediococcus claussenii]AEV94995.1 Zn-dependent peptidase [Pediococcus claussenii ATCC BAA-344]ANZ70184.1 hypothetical protein AYR57_07565 [Pediococcus claussenii]ANZ72000.1 hypothetical protein AYR58_07565 [Pediococcus claussenii]KRN19203.1 hypothetical protein IV79_GL001575 [Pediococcus claussenii]
MKKEITNGVWLDVMPTSQFKTIRVEVHFLTKSNARLMAKRALISNILETSSKKYPDQVKVTHQLSEMFGAGFGAGISKRGRLHDLSFSIITANSTYLDTQDDLFKQGIDFLREIIFNPLVTNNRFDESVFETQKDNLLNYIDSATDDKQYYAMERLRELNFGTDAIQAIPSYGRRKELEKVNNQDLFAYYQQLLQEDFMQISVSGDIDAERVLNAFQGWDLTKRNFEIPELTAQFDKNSVVAVKTEKQMLNQSKLNLAFDFPVYLRDKNYFSAIIFNALFGGTPQSKLFLNVREKASLAYYASSTLDLLNGMLMVQTGIDSVNKEEVLKIVNEQVSEMKLKKPSEKELNEAKLGLVSDYLSSLDSQRTAHRRSLTNQIMGNVLSDQEWIEGIQGVKDSDVQRMAELMNLRAVYFLSGENNV